MPFTWMGGNKSPFAYESWRWDSDTHNQKILTCHNPLSKGQPLHFLDGETKWNIRQKESKFSADDKTVCP